LIPETESSSGEIPLSLLRAQNFETSLEELQSRNRELSSAIEEITNLLVLAEKEQSFDIRFNNPHLVKCWEMSRCRRSRCPSYESDNLRCWQVAGTQCGGKVQGHFAQKLGSCAKCSVFKAARPDKITELGEIFNNMMFILSKARREEHDLQGQLIHSTKLAALGELGANIAHEINNPLAAVLAHVSLLLESPNLSEQEIADLKIIKAETLRSGRIVRHLLDFAQQSEPKISLVDINEVVRMTLSLVAPLAEASGVAVFEDFGQELPEVMADVNQMQQVFVNLINNALYSMPDGGKIIIKTRARKHEVIVSLTDTGRGIAPEILPRIFDPFFSTKGKVKGTGLGLSVTHGIIKSHRGRVEVASEVGRGSTFKVILPVVEADKVNMVMSQPA